MHPFQSLPKLVTDLRCQTIKQERRDVKERREGWSDLQAELDPAKLVFSDEPGAATKVARH